MKTRSTDVAASKGTSTLTPSALPTISRDLAALCDHREARALLEDTLACYRRALGDDHLYTCQAVEDLATVVRTQRNANK